MLAWYLNRLKEHGFLTATVLLVRVAYSRVRTELANRFLESKVSCSCCGWEGRRFHDFLEVGCTSLNAECPRCNSHARHRAFALWLAREYRLESRKGKALIFAPERALERAWQSANGLSLIKTDIEPSRGVDVMADIQRLPFTQDSFDLIWCQHVLTQIPDDRAAIRELYRVLRAGTGELVLSVAQELRDKTVEFGRANKKQMGFWRSYGTDFVERLTEGGLEVFPATYGLSAEDCARYGIAPDEGFFICTKPAST
jgi:SAM-dependent methyltransferase